MEVSVMHSGAGTPSVLGGCHRPCQLPESAAAFWNRRLAVSSSSSLSSSGVMLKSMQLRRGGGMEVAGGEYARRRRRRLVQNPSYFSVRAQAYDGSTPRHSRKTSGLEQREVVFVGADNSQTDHVESTTTATGPTTTYIGSPLLWIGVGVGLSAIFSFRYAMQQMLKSMTQSSSPGSSNPFANMAMPPPGVGFPFPMPPPASTPMSSPTGAAATESPFDVVPTSVTPSPPTSSTSDAPTRSAEPKKSVFVDVNAAQILEQEKKVAESRGYNQQAPPMPDPNRISFAEPEVVDSRGQSNNTAGPSFNNTTGGQTIFSVEQLEKMMEDPTVQKMVYPYLPEEMRNPATFKWMMQNPQYRQQLQDMLNSMGGDGAWDSRMSDMLKNFDLNSNEVKQQFEQIGLTPEEVVAKIMANPEVAVAFQNPRVQAAIMDCSQNPLNITKYQNDKEVMDVFNKISELFPGMTGTPY
ncbi:unnamed protein product [Sphagnum troendelagicum]|uniref:STI1 domain-containing protein n=1 Tax=Sphagnum troendelagicum TaxID=128251 RepID=A0ABP0UDR8_9BRYO